MLPTDRFPLITEQGHRLLRRLEEHPHAPRYTHRGYNRLTAEGLRHARAFADALRLAPPSWQHGEVPAWLSEFVERCYRDVPIYRRHGPPPGTLSVVEGFFDIPATDRNDLNREPWAFVPDSQPLDDLIIYNTSGTTGHPLDILTHPEALALYIPLLQAALATHNLALDGGPGRVAIALVCFQKRTYTYATVSAVLDQAGFVKVNLSPVNNVDVSIALRPFAIAQFNLHQFADGSLRLCLRAPNTERGSLRQALLSLFGDDQPLTIEDLATEDKVIQYTSDL